jgi:YesN/AraC family two-component response regulator
MARLNFVKAARKDVPNTDIKKGESYYWWKFRFGGKHCSKTQPKGSALINSPFLSQVAAMSEGVAEWKPCDADDLRGMIEELSSEIESLRDEQQEKLDNMPEGLQQGSSGEILQSRIDGLEEWSSNLECIDIEEPEGDVEVGEDLEREKGETAEAFAKRKEDAIEEDRLEKCEEALQNALQEAQDFCYEGD